MTDAELIEAEQLARRYGSANCWTGTSGTLAAWLLRALKIIKEERHVRQHRDAAFIPPSRASDEQGRG